MKPAAFRSSILTVASILAFFAAVADVRSDDAALIERAWGAAEAGDFAQAEQMLRDAGATLDRPVCDPLSETLEIFRRIRLDFAVTPETLLEKIRRDISDVTTADLDHWREQGVLQYRLIDGEIRYFNQAAGNLFRVSAEARGRRKDEKPSTEDQFELPRFLAKIVEEAGRSDDPCVHPVKHRVRYELHVKDGNQHVKPGARVRCWLPFPQEYRQQRDVKLISSDPPGATVAPADVPQRTLYFEQTLGDPATPPRFAAEFEFTTYAYVPKLDPKQVKPYDKDEATYREFTAERPPHIVFTPEVRRLAAEIVGDENNPLQRARLVFRWISANIPWCSEMEYSTIRNISAKGLAARGGDCGVQGLVFITLCRAAGVPARWQSGWQTLPSGSNMHDWSEIYVEPWGWLPADASYGVQDHADPRVRDFFCGHMDPYRMIVNLDYGRELSPAKTSFRSEPNDFQRGEIEIDGFNLYYDEWTWKFDVERTEP